MDLVSSILSTLSLPRISLLAPDPPLSPYSPSPTSQHADALCGSCPPSGSAPQAGTLWPSLPPSGAGFPAWPGQPTQPVPCWTGQPNTACWPVSQPAPVSVPAPISVSAPNQVITPPAPTTAMVPAPVQVPSPAVQQPCQPCWPVTQYQPPQQPAPIQTQVPAPAITPTATIHPSLPGWPAHPGWPYNPGQSGWPGQNPSMMPPHWLPPTSGPMSVPYNLNLARGVYDKMMMTILGHVKPNAKMFTVNFLRGNDIAFHINPRFTEGGKQVVVRNHKVGDRWGPEERDLKGPFPFAPGSPFEMKILCTPEAFRVAVNNIPLFEFRHRIRELNQIDRINILNDVILTYVNVETLP
ncbi:galectin-3 isoform X1 [Girardinichthys multiradiatus]|uniref:galectin-3 isoform X1 n=1 Tax=Girardinichthys multiradiatus TaxID=208333 RepID=UPI001FADDF37|nr:galectin-3 isoform X1 [Girardinichthys multiradiatus]